MSSELTIREDQTAFTPAQITALESLGVQKAQPAEVAMFFDQCQRTGLSPWARQIYMIGRWDKRLGREKYQVQVSIDGLRLVAERTAQYEGQTAPQWCGDDGVWREVWLSKDAPAAARVGVWREKFREPAYGVARLDAYMPLTRDGSPSGLWRTMPDVMLAKCAEALALRKAFPMELSGLYTTDEMQQADRPVEQSRPVETVEAEVVEDTSQQWVDAIHGARDRDALMSLWSDAQAKGALDATPALRDVFAARGRDLRDAA